MPRCDIRCTIEVFLEELLDAVNSERTIAGIASDFGCINCSFLLFLHDYIDNEILTFFHHPPSKHELH